MTTNTDKIPWVSFCLATYRRQDILCETLNKIQQQTMHDFEVIVSDNDPEATSRSIVENMQDIRFKYFYNTENLGMVKNFNKALKKASGEFVVMITDDDPPYPDMLSILRSLQEQFPSYGAYYGACSTKFVNSDLAKLYNSSEEAKHLANLPINAIRTFSSSEFPIAYFSNSIFPYILWSTGIVRKNIAIEIGGMPDYNSPYFTDFGYICLAGSHSGCVTINTILGYQTVHDGNFGRKQFGELKKALEGCYDYIYKKMVIREDWVRIRPKLEGFLANWIINHSLFLKKYFKFDKESKKQLSILLLDIFKLPYMRPFIGKYLLYAYTPNIAIKMARKVRNILRKIVSYAMKNT